MLLTKLLELYDQNKKIYCEIYFRDDSRLFVSRVCLLRITLRNLQRMDSQRRTDCSFFPMQNIQLHSFYLVYWTIWRVNHARWDVFHSNNIIMKTISYILWCHVKRTTSDLNIDFILERLNFNLNTYSTTQSRSMWSNSQSENK